MVICLQMVLQLMPLRLIISCFIKIHTGLTFLVPAYPGCPEKQAVKCLFVCPFSVLTLLVGLVGWDLMTLLTQIRS